MNPSLITPEQAKELLDAQTHIWNYALSFHKSMALKCALELGIPDAIRKHGQPVSLTALANSLSIHPTKTPSLFRLMRFLAHSNFFSMKKLGNGETGFDLTINSHLLLTDHPLNLSPHALVILDPVGVESSFHLSSWFGNNDKDFTPFHISNNGRSMWEYAGNVPKFNESFNRAMKSDARFVASLLVANKGLFEGIESLVDVGGGIGTMAKALAKAFPRIKCVVLDLPHVVDGLQGKDDGNSLVYMGGNMFEQIPSADAIMLKWILHDWSDEHCIKILKRCKEAISSTGKGGKVIIIDMVVDNNNCVADYLDSQYLFDMEMMSLTVGGKERTEEEWKELFINAGFNNYKIFSALGSRSVIEIHC